jgi:dTDP-4-dehydrorhamnose reductase
MNKKVLLLGQSGFVGNVVKEHMVDKCSLLFMEKQLNVTLESIDKFIKNLEKKIDENKVEVLVNCIAKANLDDCETDRHNCLLINTILVKKIVDLLKVRSHIKFVHISTNAVYDGDNAPYSENDLCYPINYYGECKLEADLYVADNLDYFAIARPITVYGPKKNGQRDNPVTFCIRKLVNGESLTLVDDNIVNMIHVEDLSYAIEKLCLGDKIGIYNLAGDISECRYDLGVRITNILNISKDKIEKVSGAIFKVKAKRPINTAFSNEKMKSELGIIPRDFDCSIQDMINDKSY